MKINELPYILLIKEDGDWALYHVKMRHGDNMNLIKTIYSSLDKQVHGGYTEKYTDWTTWVWGNYTKHEAIIKFYETIEECIDENFELFLKNPNVL